MDSALSCFASEGYKSTTISQVAHRAGISKGLIYSYFQGKETLLLEVLLRSATELHSRLRPRDQELAAQQDFESYVRDLTSLFVEKRSSWRLFFRMIMQQDIREQFDRMRNMLKGTDVSDKIPDDDEFIPGITRRLESHFSSRERERGLEAATELSLFKMTMKGFAVTYLFSEKPVDRLFKREVERIIAIFK